MRFWTSMILAGSAWIATAGSAAGADVEAAPDAPPSAGAKVDPATSGGDARTDANAEIDALIKQLGAKDFDDREAAVAELKRIGEPALPALKRAVEHGNAEVSSRADVVIRDLQRLPEPAPLPGSRLERGHDAGFAVGRRGFVGGVRMNVRVQNDNRQIEVVEQNRKITIVEGPDGIQMSVTGQRDGKEVTRDFQARTPEQLREQNAEAFELYDRFAGRGGMIRGHAGLVMPGGGGAFIRRGIEGGDNAFVRIRPPRGVVVPPGPVDNRVDVAELERLNEMLERQLEAAEAAQDRRREAEAGILDRMRQARAAGRDPLDAREEMVRELDEFDRPADAIREPAAAPKHPDAADDVLPRPGDTRLAIEVIEDADEGVTVLHVVSTGRAARIGLEPLDVITKVNGQPVGDANELRRAVSDANSPLVIEGTRDGKPLKIEEKVAPPAVENPVAGEDKLQK